VASWRRGEPGTPSPVVGGGELTPGKVLPLSAALHESVHDGDTLFVGGFGQGVPFASGHELIRQGRRRLSLCRSGAEILFDQLIGAGCVSKVIFGWIGNPGIGLAHAFRRAVGLGSIEVEEWTNFSMALRLQAAAMGVPYLPTRVLRGGDIAGASATVAEVTCPFTGEALSAVPALAPDVALIHAQRADELGNTQMWGIIGDSVVGALASRRIVVTVEEVVSRDLIREDPNRTVIPGYRVSAVCHEPWGAHPSYVQGYYTRDDTFYRSYDVLSRTQEGLDAYLGEWVLGVAGREEYAAKIDTEALKVSGPPAPPVGYGFDRS
jgi:glutaconate CoA-transferase subunit A